MVTVEKERSTVICFGVYDVVSAANFDMQLDRHDANAIEIGDGPRSVDVMVAKLRDRVRWGGRIELLRLHGPIISCDNLDDVRPSLARLRGCFSRAAVVWLVGCAPGPESTRLIDQLARLWNVVVTLGPATTVRASHADPFGYSTSTVTSIN